MESPCESTFAELEKRVRFAREEGGALFLEDLGFGTEPEVEFHGNKKIFIYEKEEGPYTIEVHHITELKRFTQEVSVYAIMGGQFARQAHYLLTKIEMPREL